MRPEDEQKRMGKFMLIGMWVLLVIMLTYLFRNILDRQHNPNQELASRVTGEYAEVVLKRNKFGHYVASGKINGQPVVFMLDTGATHVAVPARVAGRLGLKRGRKRIYQTANGPAAAWATVLDSVSLGDIEVRDVRASINPQMDNEEILLGMSFLKQIEFTQRGDLLILRQY